MNRLIALSGRAGSGKDTVAGFIPGAVRMPFAEPLKHFVQEVFDFTDDQIWGPSAERNRPDPRYTREDGVPLTPRHALQTLGTEWGRSCFPDVWAKLTVRRALRFLEQNPGAVVVITDCRFLNEARVVREAGGQLWRVVRPGAGLAGSAGQHASEVEQESPEFLSQVDVTILNDGTLEQLRDRVLELVRGPDTLLAEYHAHA